MAADIVCWTERRRVNYRRGRLSEWIAEFLLRLKGYAILARRLRTPVGELDLVARRGRRLAFVEVKLRATLDDAGEAITPRQRKRLLKAASYWLVRHASSDDDVAFDAVLLAPGRFPQHMRDVFPFA
jgi:putative endonuclease